MKIWFALLADSSAFAYSANHAACPLDCQKHPVGKGRPRCFPDLFTALLEAAEVGVQVVAHNTKTFLLKPANGERIPFDYVAGQFLTLHIEPRGIPLLHHCFIARP